MAESFNPKIKLFRANLKEVSLTLSSFSLGLLIFLLIPIKYHLNRFALCPLKTH